MTWFNIPFLQFLLGSLAGMTIRMTIIVWIGAKAKDIIQMLNHPQQVPELQWFTVGGTTIGIILLYFVLRKSKA
jgi:membrane protein DedA with SNARE-associated domain